MRIALDHSKILKEIMSDGFRHAMEDGFIPSLSDKFGSALDCVMMYEDYLSDNFVFGGYCYYPLTVVVAGVAKTLWIKWNIQQSSLFEGSNPYAYLGDCLEIEIASDTPMAFESAMENRAIYAPEGSVKVTVSAAVKDFSVLSGKYSQEFVDEMARQLTGAIEKAAAVSGLAQSSIELTLFFAPDTYMEHTSENVTYRRLLISAKGSAARDLWVKWTRLDSDSAYSVKDRVSADTILFELGEGVSHKIREKEYRFLVYTNPEKYRMAMGRKNVVEWRELIKRAVKKGELMKINGSIEENKHVSEVSDKLAEILERAGVAAPNVKLAEDFKDDTSEVENALRMAIASSGASVSEPVVPQMPAEGSTDDSFDEDARDDIGTLDSDNVDTVSVSDTANEDADKEDADADEFPLPDSSDFVFGGGDGTDDTDAPEIIEIVKPKADDAIEAPKAPDTFDVTVEKSGFDLMVDIQTLEAKLRNEKEETEKAILDKELCERKLEVALEANKELSERADRLEAELIAKKNIIDAIKEESDAVKYRYEEQNKAIDEYKESIEILKSKVGELESLLESARAEIKAKEEQLREQIMLDQKEKEREKLLYAEAARLARMEADKLEREKIEAELREKEERERLEAEAERERAEAEKAKAEDEHKRELIRIEKEIEAERERKATDLERAKEIRLRMEAEAKEKIGEKYGESAPLAADEDAKTEIGEPEASEPEKEEKPAVKSPEIDFSVEEDSFKPTPKEEPKPEPVVPKTPVYVSKQIKLLFVDAQDVRITEKLRTLIGEVIKKEGKSSVYIKMKASLLDSNTVVLDVLEIPEDETGLLVEMIKYIGSAGLGIYKGTLE